MNPLMTLRKMLFAIRGKVIRLRPKGASRGSVLVAYTTLPFIDTNPEILNGHSNRWECVEICRIFLEKGYAVDLIDFENDTFVPKKGYTYVVDVGNNLERFLPRLSKSCIKIFHATGAYWAFQNTAEEKRLADLNSRRGALLSAKRAVPENSSAEYADMITLIGNDFTEGTYAHLKKKVVRIPVSTTHVYPSPAEKDFERARRHFIWFGGAGAVHKGLDLVLEAFAAMPEFSLHVCGKVEQESDFMHIYEKELLHTENIHLEGWTDPGSERFKQLAAESIGLVYPSCSEGSAGSVVLAMHAGLIPVVSYESGVSVGDFGIILKESTVDEIKSSINHLSSLSREELRTRSVAAWTYANTHHTREKFAAAYRGVIRDLEQTRYYE